jgi:hypothetical protein
MNVHDDGRFALVRCYVATLAWLAFGWHFDFISEIPHGHVAADRGVGSPRALFAFCITTSIVEV